MSATDCACGCGKPTLLGRIAPLAAEGKSRRQIAAETGMSYGHVKLVLAKPPRYIQGHFRNEPDAYLKRRITIIETNRFERLRLADYVARGRRLNNGKLLRDGAAQARAAALRTSVLAADIKAFDLGLMVASFKPREYAAPGVALGIRETYRVERLAAQFGRAQRTRQERERVTDQILWLREQVGRGWRQDAPPLAERYMFSSLDALTTADDGSNVDWFWFQHTQDEQDRREQEHEAAAALMAAPHLQSLIRVALATPQNLRLQERELLRSHFERAMAGEAMPMIGEKSALAKPVGQGVVPFAALSPTGQGDLKRGSGNGRHGHHNGLANPGRKRFEGKREIVAERTLREARRERGRLR